MERRTAILSIALVGVLAGLAGLLILAPGEALGGPHCVDAEAEYLPFEAIMARADVRVIGKVSGYSPQQGPYHDIKITVSTNLKGNAAPRPGQTIAIAAGGNSPRDGCPSPSTDPQIGQQVIAFARMENISTGGITTRRAERLLAHYVLVGSEIYRGGPDDETINLEDLLHRMQQIGSAKLTPEDIGYRLDEPPPDMKPAISMERAYEIAAEKDGYAKTTPDDRRSARFVIVTYTQHWHEPVWLLTFSGVRLLPNGCMHTGPLEPTPLPCGYNSEWNLMVNAMTGEVIGGFSFR